MVKHEEKYCPRCGIIFECKVGSINLCQCSEITLKLEELDYMHQKFIDCLCINFMKELRAGYHNDKLKNRISKLLGKHTYK
jgi:hypothetical protein